MKFSISGTKRKRVLWAMGTVLAIIGLLLPTFLGVCEIGIVNALSAEKMSEFSQNNILFYDPDECEEESGSCGYSAGSLPAETIVELDAQGVKAKAEQNMERYKYAEEQTGIFWQAIAALHYREGGMDPNKSISNGSTLTTDGSCYANADGVQVCGDANEDAKAAAEHFISLAGYFSDEGDPSEDDATLADYGAAFATYKGGEIYQCNNKKYTDTTYVMNGIDEDHMSMVWQEFDVVRHANSAHSYCTYKEYTPQWIGKSDNIGALTVFIYLGGGERVDGGEECSKSTIAETAKKLSWAIGERPDDVYLGNDAYNEAAKKRGGYFANPGKGTLRVSTVSGLPYSCARFVSLVLLESGADPDFVEDSKVGDHYEPHMISVSPGGLTYYLQNSSNWEEVADYDGNGYDKLQAGDILLNDSDAWVSTGGAPDHTFIYIGDGKVAEASSGEYAAYQHEWNNNGYRAFRLKSSVSNSSSSASSNKSTTSSGSINYDRVKSAKNATKSFFNGSGDVPSANWSDTDMASMKQLLETYGDLAYQLGEAVGAPYVAILVQMRYEDPNSRCGKNNFWGNGCPPGTGVGGASKQGENLGEGFILYGETLTNGYHDQALGISDPKEYLEKIGPTWVQGNINGAGYGAIEGMKKSVDALQAYIDSDEGQKIVKNFGNYHSDNVGNCGEETTEGNGDINQTAIDLAWPEHGHNPWTEVKPAYKTALAEIGVNRLGDSCSMNGNSCDAFVTTVMRYSGADPDFVCCGVSNGGPTWSYVTNSSKYEEVPNDLEHLQPGDIRLSAGHIEIYVEVNGQPKIASASHCDRTGEIGDYYDSSRFKAYRLKK